MFLIIFIIITHSQIMCGLIGNKQVSCSMLNDNLLSSHHGYCVVCVFFNYYYHHSFKN